jgi:hypothetical protein
MTPQTILLCRGNVFTSRSLETVRNLNQCDRRRIQNDASDKSSVVACIRCRENVSTDLLQSNNSLDAHADTPTGTLCSDTKSHGVHMKTHRLEHSAQLGSDAKSHGMHMQTYRLEYSVEMTSLMGCTCRHTDWNTLLRWAQMPSLMECT